MKVRGCYISITLSRFVLKCEVVLDNILVNKYTISMFMRPLFWLRMGVILCDCFTRKISSAFHAFVVVQLQMSWSCPTLIRKKIISVTSSSALPETGMVLRKTLIKIPVHMLHVVVDFRKLFSLFHSVTQSCPTLFNPMDCITPGFPVYHQLPEFAQIHVHQVGDTIQPFYPLSSPSPPTFNLSQHQGLFQSVSSSHQMAKVLEFQLQHQSFQWIFRTDFL